MKLILTTFIVFLGLPVLANGITDWQLGFQEPASGHMQNIRSLN